jgi:hypothetical protein
LNVEGPSPAQFREWQRIDYAGLPLSLDATEAAGAGRPLSEALADWLVPHWSEAYGALGGSSEIVEVTEGRFTYLFDIAAERAIAAYGVTQATQPSPRDKSRIAGFPSSEARYQKGHLIAHRLGGGLDVNLFHQLGAANIGPFRRLEAEAAENPDSFYFVRLLYATPSLPRTALPAEGRSTDLQRPKWVEQGLVLPQAPFRLILREFEN